MKSATPTSDFHASECRKVLDCLELMLTHDLTPAVRSHIEHLRAVYLKRWADAVIARK